MPVSPWTRSVSWSRRPEVLTSANTVKPMHGVVPRDILGKEWWDATRAAAYRATNYHCIACGVSKLEAEEYQWLEGHEVYEVNYATGRMIYLETVPLCHYCHNFIHDGRLKALLDKKEVTKEKFDAVMEHGVAVLREAGLQKKHYSGPMAEWKNWRMILDGVAYPPLYPSYEEWKAHFGLLKNPCAACRGTGRSSKGKTCIHCGGRGIQQ